jgi:hypothetical protein
LIREFLGNSLGTPAVAGVLNRLIRNLFGLKSAGASLLIAGQGGDNHVAFFVVHPPSRMALVALRRHVPDGTA